MREFDKQMEMILYHSDEGELHKEATVSKMEIVQKEGNRDVRKMTVFYNLDAKFHYAITEHTAAEILYESADYEKTHGAYYLEECD